MDPKNRHHLQDIYATNKSEDDAYTPQVSKEVINEHKRALQWEYSKNILLGVVLLGLLLSLVYIITKTYLTAQKRKTILTSLSSEYVPRFSLKSEEQWILDYSTDFGDPKWDGKGEHPFNAEWVKKAAFDIVMAQQAIQIKEYKTAIVHYKKALEIYPKIEGVKVALGSLYFKTRQFEKALTILENIPDSDLTPEIRNNLGVACLDAKAYDRAEKYLKKALERKEPYAEPYKNLALVYKAQNKDDQAIKNFEHYIDLKPEDLDTRNSYALYLTSIERWEIAANVLNKLTEEITDVPNLYFLLAQVQIKNNQLEQAMKAYKRGMQLSDAPSELGYLSDKDFDKLRKNKDFKAMIESSERKK